MKMTKINSSTYSSSSSLENATTVTLDESFSDHNYNHGDHPSNKTLRRRYQQSMDDSSSSMATTKHRDNLKSDEESKIHGAKQQTPQSPILLLICASGICTCYLYYGIVQEKLFSKSSNNELKNCGNTTTFMLVLSCITNVLVSIGWLWTEKRLSNDPVSTTDKRQSLNLNHKVFFQCTWSALEC